MVSAAFHQQYRDTETKRESDRDSQRKKKKKTGKDSVEREERRRRRAWTEETVDGFVFSVFVSAGMFESKSEVMSSGNTSK